MRTVVALLILVSIFVVGGGAGYLWYLPVTKAVDAFLLSQRVPADLRDMFLYGGDAASTEYRISSFGLRETEDTEFFMPSWVVSPDGSRVVYAQKKETKEPAPFVSGVPINASEWEIYERPRDGSSSEPLVEGYAPGYLDDTHIAYLTDAGITVLDLTNNIATLIYAFPEGTTLDSMVRYAPNRSALLFKSANTHEVIVGSITATQFAPLNVITATQPDHFILTNTGFYETRMHNEDLEIWWQDYSGQLQELMLTLPASLNIHSVLL